MGQPTVHDELGSSFASDHCSLLIPAPADSAVYRCFQSIARQWKQQLTSEQLFIEGDVPMGSGLTQTASPPGIAKILHANLDVIARIQLAFGGLCVAYVRSGGHAHQVQRKIYFDEIRLELNGVSTLSQAEIGQLVLLLATCLRVSAARGSAAFDEFTDGLPIRVRHVHGEQRT
jgi:hypothetical protein